MQQFEVLGLLSARGAVEKLSSQAFGLEHVPLKYETARRSLQHKQASSTGQRQRGSHQLSESLVLRKACFGNRTDMQRQVRFQYPTDTEVRYLDHLPEIGDHVSSSLGDAFVVQEVRHDGAGWVV